MNSNPLIGEEKEMHAWFSTIQKNNILDPIRLQHCKYHKLHTNIYLTECGKEIEVTEITYIVKIMNIHVVFKIQDTWVR